MFNRNIMMFLILLLSISLYKINAFSNINNNFNEVVNGCLCVRKEMCLDDDATINGEGLLDIR